MIRVTFTIFGKALNNALKATFSPSSLPISLKILKAFRAFSELLPGHIDISEKIMIKKSIIFQILFR